MNHENIMHLAEATLADRVEMVLLATVMKEPALFASAISGGLGSHCFTTKPMQYIMRIAEEQFKQRGRVSEESVFAEIKEKDGWDKAGGIDFMTKLSSTYADPYTFEDNLTRVLEAREFQEVRNAWWDVNRMAFQEDGLSTRERLKKFHEGVNEILHSQSNVNMTTFDSARLNQIIIDNLNAALEGKRPKLQKSGILALDDAVGGFKPGRVTLVGARPSHGKTSFATWLSVLQNEAWRRAGEDGQALYFACEMDEDSMGDRILSSISGINSMRIANGDLSGLEQMDVKKAAQYIRDNIRISVDTHSSPTSSYMMSTALSLNAIEPIRMVIFDYLEYTGEQANSKDIRLEKALIGAHELAKRLDCPVIVLSQLNRELEKRGPDARPQLADIRYTGAGENIAGMVMMLYHPWTHWIQRGGSTGEEGEPDPQHYEVLIRKNTHGPVGEVHLRFFRETTSFSDPMMENRQNGTLKAVGW